MRNIILLMVAAIVHCPFGLARTYAIEELQEHLKTGVLGGVEPPSVEELTKMGQSNYILHARGGKLTKVPAEKQKLPHDPQGHCQFVSAVRAPDGTIYVALRTIMCKSTDGGRTWTSHQRDWQRGDEVCFNYFEILDDGRFISVISRWDEVTAKVYSSSDEGRTWTQFSEIDMPSKPKRIACLWNYGIFRLPDGTLLYALLASDAKPGEHGKMIDGARSMLLAFRSTDNGKTWQGPSVVADWSGEGGIARTVSGKLVAVLRYQRGAWPDDPPDFWKKTGAPNPTGCPLKHVFLADSDDQGRTWKNVRQLTTIFGQARGYPAALSDGTLLVLHDTRYGPGPKGSRAMVSYDEGVNWEDEVYYVGGFGDGYNASLVLEDDVILTLDATAPPSNTWADAIGRTDVTAIRWKAERPEE